MTDILHFDLETAADADLTKVGLDVYSSPASNPRVLMAAWSINGSRVHHWQIRQGRFPAGLREAIEDPEVEKWAFNAAFERVISKRVLGLRTTRKNWRCSQVLAYMQSFFGGLEDVGEQIGLPVDKQKLKTGKHLIRTFTMPQRTTKNQPHLWRNWITDPEEWQEFCEYNVQDVVTEMAVRTRLIRYPIQDDEWEFYELDQLINDRGIPVDMDFVDNIIWMSARRKAELLTEMESITGLKNPNSVQQLLPWLRDRGYPYPDLQKGSVLKAIKRHPDRDADDEEKPHDLRILLLRQWASRTSTSKAITAKRVVGAGERIRYLFQFAGAGRTNRFAGRLVQSQNLMRTPKEFEVEDNDDDKLSFVTNLIRSGDYGGFDLVLKEPMLAFTGVMRSMFRAPEGQQFVTSDYSSIESVGLAWLSGCERLLDVFRNGRDAYKDFGVEFYNKPYDLITKFERQVVKPACLGCGYRLSAGKDIDGVKTGLLGYAENMGIEMMLEDAIRAVKVFRETYPEIPKFWKALEVAIASVLRTHQPATVGPLGFEWLKPYLLMRLPSGRYVYYYKPRLETHEVSSGRMVERRSKGLFEDGYPKGELFLAEETYLRTNMTYMGKNQKNSQWTRLSGHGGVVTENATQAFTRDILKVGLTRLHKEGYYLVGHAHDEGMALARTGDNRFTVEGMNALFKEPIEWAPGLPLGANGWAGAYYRK